MSFSDHRIIARCTGNPRKLTPFDCLPDEFTPHQAILTVPSIATVPGKIHFCGKNECGEKWLLPLECLFISAVFCCSVTQQKHETEQNAISVFKMLRDISKFHTKDKEIYLLGILPEVLQPLIDHPHEAAVLAVKKAN